MKKLLFVIGLFIAAQVNAQSVTVGKNIHTDIPGITKQQIINALDSLVYKIGAGKLNINDVEQDKGGLTVSILKDQQADINDTTSQKQLINMYPVALGQYFISMAVMSSSGPAPSLKKIINLIACDRGGKITFALPLNYLTRLWKIRKVGNIIYHYQDEINIDRAKKFNEKNTLISTKLGLQPEVLNFYLCNNYQEILPLLGLGYSAEANGNTRNGYGVDANCIFSVMHNEDFSHDLFHYYAAKVRKAPRNSAAEEGIAYSWGNAYYTDEKGEMILQKNLVIQLRLYLQQHPNASLYDMFSKNPTIFNSMAKVRSVISGVICDEVERQKGTSGIIALINCGKGDDNYLATVNSLININKTNFDTAVKALLK
ncbi:hypothetical protein [Mucilaginibacter endophyticus]|uniref:hypothetical protein n=1 Tax=Mucilaginibacter endophyticus TaxID=2675003 RepID=UPI0012B17DF7|nr:hypothetical protein [Mucilaginibacter endophyticus]